MQDVDLIAAAFVSASLAVLVIGVWVWLVAAEWKERRQRKDDEHDN